MKQCFLCLGLIAFGIGCGGDAAKPTAVAPPNTPAQVADGAATPSTSSEPQEKGSPGGSAGDADSEAATAASPAGPAAPPLAPPPAPGGAAKGDADGEPDALTMKLDAAEEALLDDKPEVALKTVEASLKADGVTRRGLLLKSRILETQAREFIRSEPKRAVALYEQCVDAYQQADKKFADLERFEKRQWGAACYDLGCSLALAENPAKAFDVLKDAYRLGFDDIDHYEQDADLESVRKLPEYVAFREEKREIARERLRTAFAEFRPIDVSFEATTLDGKKFATEELKGKVLIVDCWATWCPPCRKMLPVLSETHKRYHEQGLEIVGVNFENGEEDEAKSAIEEFLEKTPLPYPCVVKGTEIQPKLPFFAGIPTCFFVDRFGKIRYRTTGARSLEEVETIVKLLLEAKEVPSVNEK